MDETTRLANLLDDYMLSPDDSRMMAEAIKKALLSAIADPSHVEEKLLKNFNDTLEAKTQ